MAVTSATTTTTTSTSTASVYIFECSLISARIDFLNSEKSWKIFRLWRKRWTFSLVARVIPIDVPPRGWVSNIDLAYLYIFFLFSFFFWSCVHICFHFFCFPSFRLVISVWYIDVFVFNFFFDIESDPDYDLIDSCFIFFFCDATTYLSIYNICL